jgi:hypothetical protein
MRKIDIIYKRFQKNKIINVSDMDGIQWFSLSSDYGIESYGPVVHTYTFKEKPKLLDIGKLKNRQEIEDYISTFEPDFKEISNPDYQYSGGKSNYKYHFLVKKYFYKEYDGTIIIEDEVDSEELEGPTEIVLWKNFSKLLKCI